MEEETKKKKNKIKDIKEFLSDKRNKAIVKLIIYLIFFVFVIIYIRIMNYRANNYTKKVDPEEIIELPKTITNEIALLKNTKNYNFRYEVNIINNNISINYIIDGKRYNDRYYFSIFDNELNLNYYYEENSNKLYLINGETKEEIGINNIMDLSLYKIDNIYSYLYNATYNYKQENANGDILINSSLPISKFYELNKMDKISNENIIIETTENADIIKISLNTSNVDIDNFNIINIYVSNINDVEDFVY